MIDNKLVSDFKRPRGVSLRTLDETGNVARFTASPYERGFATTLGNSLRRTLLSSLSGYAIVAVNFDGIMSEYEGIPGVTEDPTTICINLKKVAIALAGGDAHSRVLHYEVKGKKDFTAGDLIKDDNIIIGNPDFVLFRANKDANFSFDIQVSQGKGYVPSEAIEANIEVRGTIPLDADYSPVKKVGFSVQPTSVGGRTDFERMDMVVETNGVVSPKDALTSAAQILKECYFTFSEVEEELLTTAVDDVKVLKKNEEDEVFNKTAHQLDVLVKTHYFFKVNDIREIGQLVMQKEADLRSKKRFEEEILFDIVNVLREQNLSLDMKGVNYVAKRV